jgi:hypothetical protein
MSRQLVLELQQLARLFQGSDNEASRYTTRTLLDAADKLERLTNGTILRDVFRLRDKALAENDELRAACKGLGETNEDMWKVIEEAKTYRAKAAAEIARLRRVEEALGFYGTEGFYDMTSFTTAARLNEAGVPRNVEVQENPIMHDRGKRARAALAEPAEPKDDGDAD